LYAMAEAVDDISQPEADKSEEVVEVVDANTESTTTTDVEAAANASEAGDSGNEATEVNAGETIAADASTEEEKTAVDAAATVETSAVSEDDAAKESVVSTTADDDVAVVTSEVETEETGETAVLPADETLTAISPDDAEDKLASAVADEGATDTTERVEHVISKADKVTISVETPNTADASAEAAQNTADSGDAAVVAKPDATDAGTAVNKTTQDVIKMAGNDELKFGVLIGLVRVGQLSNKDVVDSVLCLVSTRCSVIVSEVVSDARYKSHFYTQVVCVSSSSIYHC